MLIYALLENILLQKYTDIFVNKFLDGCIDEKKRDHATLFHVHVSCL